MSSPSPSPVPRGPTAWRLWPLLLGVWLLPLLLVGPSLAPGTRFLPFAPVQFEPLRRAHPEAAQAADRGTNQWTADRIFPVLTDQLGFERAWARGESGAWDPHLGLGLSRFGNAIHGPDYPPNQLLRWLPGDRAAAPLAILSLALAGLGLGLLLRSRGCSLLATAVGVLALQSAGFGPRNLHYGMKVDAVLWLPWTLWVIEGWARGRRACLPAIGLFAGLPFLAGFPPIAAFAWCAALCFAGGRLARAGPARWLPAAAALGLGPLLAASQLLPTLAASADSLRQVKGAAALSAEALPPASLASLLLPDLFGSPLSEPEPFGPAAAWWLARPQDGDQAQLAQGLEWDCYGGAAALLLLLVALAVEPRRALWPAGLALFALGFAQAWPGVALLYHLPPLAGGAPARALALLWIALGWGAALGAEVLSRGGRGARLALALALPALLLGAWLQLAPPDPARLTAALAERFGRPLEEALALLPEAAQARGIAQLERGARALSGGALAVLLAAGLALLGRRALWALPLCLWSLIELRGFSSMHALPRDLGGQPIWPASPLLAELSAALGDGRLVRCAGDRAPEQAAIVLARPNLPGAYGLRDLSAYVAFNQQSLVECLEAVAPGSRFRSGFAGLPDPSALGAPFLDAARVTAVLSTTPLAHPRLAALREEPGWCLYRRRMDLPPARFVPEEQCFAARAELLAAIADPAWQPGERLHRLTSGPAAGEPRLTRFESRPPPPVERPAPEHLRVELGAGPAGRLVLSEQFDRGWSARIDGRPARPFEADGCFLAVEIPAGAARLELAYAAPGRALGGWLALGAALLLLGLWRLAPAPGPARRSPHPDRT
jgi:hypothetical protein